MRQTTYDRVKRVGDIAPAAVGLVLGSPALFRQGRPGENGRLLTLVKFRSMLAPNPARGLGTDVDRLTPFGAFPRSTSLDELPALWNVMRGDMSFVGPRPLRTSNFLIHSQGQARRSEVRPATTGLAQVSGRNELSWEERFRLDVEYVDTRSIVDIRILLRTLARVLSRRGTSALGHITMKRLTASSQGGGARA